MPCEPSRTPGSPLRLTTANAALLGLACVCALAWTAAPVWAATSDQDLLVVDLSRRSEVRLRIVKALQQHTLKQVSDFSDLCVALDQWPEERLVQDDVARALREGAKSRLGFQWRDAQTKYRSAIERLDQSLTSLCRPQLAAELHVWMAVALWADQQPEAAASELRQALERDPELVPDRGHLAPDIVERFDAVRGESGRRAKAPELQAAQLMQLGDQAGARWIALSTVVEDGAGRTTWQLTIYDRTQARVRETAFWVGTPAPPAGELEAGIQRVVAQLGPEWSRTQIAEPRPWYASPWVWGAAAAVAGGATVWLLSDTKDSVRLEVQ